MMQESRMTQESAVMQRLAMTQESAVMQRLAMTQESAVMEELFKFVMRSSGSYSNENGAK